MTFFLIGRTKSKTKNERSFANVGKIEQKGRCKVYHNNCSKFIEHIEEKVWFIFNQLTSIFK